LLGLFGEGGDAHDEFVAFLQAGVLELADVAEPKVDGPDDTTLHLVLDLLLSEDQALAEGGNKLWTVRRDPRGYAQATLGYFDANATVLAAGKREAKGLIERAQAGEPSIVEK
jgi:hypothetical protein